MPGETGIRSLQGNSREHCPQRENKMIRKGEPGGQAQRTTIASSARPRTTNWQDSCGEKEGAAFC